MVAVLRVRLHIIRNERIENVGKSQSCMVSKLRIICKQTVAVAKHSVLTAFNNLYDGTQLDNTTIRQCVRVCVDIIGHARIKYVGQSH